MQPVNLFELASQQARWLSVRQSAVSGNLANANTPGYAAVDIEPFQAVLDKTGVAMRTTNPRHILVGASSEGFNVRQTDEKQPTMPSGNTVVLEKELIKAGEVRRTFELNTAIVKSFHRMLLATTRS